MEELLTRIEGRMMDCEMGDLFRSTNAAMAVQEVNPEIEE